MNVNSVLPSPKNNSERSERSCGQGVMELYKVDQSRATVVLCSFYGATSQVRQKYGEIWVGKGFSVITMSRGSPDARTGYITPESDAEQAVKAKGVLDTMIANGLGEQKVIFHIMSEGGISSWLQLSQLMSTNSNVRKNLLNGVTRTFSSVSGLTEMATRAVCGIQR